MSKNHNTEPTEDLEVDRCTRVYLIHEPTVARNAKQLKLDPLDEWGDIFPLIRSGNSVRDRPEQCMQIIFDRLKDFRPDHDYMVWAGGDSLAAIMVGVALERMQIDKIRWLFYHVNRDAKHPLGIAVGEGFYTAHTITLYEALQRS